MLGGGISGAAADVLHSASGMRAGFSPTPALPLPPAAIACSAPPASPPLPCRFERPDSRNRWDAPLFTLRPHLGAAGMQETLEAIAAAVADAPRQQQGAAPAAAAGQGGGAPAANGAAAAAAAAADAEAGGGLDGPAPLLQAKQLKPKSATDTPMLAGAVWAGQVVRVHALPSCVCRLAGLPRHPPAAPSFAEIPTLPYCSHQPSVRNRQGAAAGAASQLLLNYY